MDTSTFLPVLLNVEDPVPTPPTPTLTPSTPTESVSAPPPSPSETSPTTFETGCGTIGVQESCVYFTPEQTDFFGAGAVLIVLLLAAVLAAQLRRP